MAEVILSSQLAARAIPAQVASAGLLPGGLALPPETRAALESLGPAPGLETFVSQQLQLADVRSADLVLGLAREHVREIVVRAPDAWDHSFTLKELIRRGEAVGPRHLDEALPAWLSRAAKDRSRNDLLGSSDADDVLDPIGGTPAGFERTAREIERLCRSLVGLLWP